MAAPSYATDLTDIYLDTDNFSTVGGGRVTAAETDDYIQGNNCWSHDPFSSGIEGGVYDTVTAETIASGDAVFIWTKCDVAATLATHAAGGVQALIGNAPTALKAFYIAGSDDYQYGGWKCYPVDPTKTQSTSIGSPSGTWDHFGVRWNVPGSGATKGYPMKIDAMRHGSKVEVTAGDSGTPATWDALAAHDATTTRQWGICQPTNTGAAVQGEVWWGTAATAVYSRDSNRSIVIIDTEWTASYFTVLQFANTSNDIVWDNVGLVALGTNNRGIINVIADGTVTWTNSVFEGIDVSTLKSNCTFDGSKWLSCNEIDADGASLVGCQILTPTVAVGSHGLLWDVATDPNGLLDGIRFEKGTNAHAALELGTNTASTISLSGHTYVGFNTSTGSNPTASTGANDCAIYNNSGKAVTINIVGGGDLPSVRNGAGATTVVVLSKGYELTNLANPSEVTILDRDISLEDLTGTPTATPFGATGSTGAVFEQENSGNTGTNTPASVDVTLGSDTTAGNKVIIVVSCDATVSTPTDFTLDQSQVNNNGHYVFSKTAVAETASWTVTPASNASIAWAVYEISGLATSAADQTQSAGTSGTTNSQSTGTTGTTTTADELILGTVGQSKDASSGAVFDMDSWTNGFSPGRDWEATTKGTGTNVGVAVAFLTASSTGTFETTAAWSGDPHAATGIIATYAIATGSGSAKQGQSFEVSTAGNVERIRLNLRKVGSPTDDVTIRLVNGVPGSSLTSTSVRIKGEDLTTSFVEYDVDLNGKYALATSTTYGIEIQRTGIVDGTNYYEIEHSTASIHSTGTRYVYDGGWSTDTGDLLFSVMEAASDNSLYHVETVTTGSTTYTHGGTAKAIEVLVASIVYKQVILIDTIGGQDKSVPVLQIPDLVYNT